MLTINGWTVESASGEREEAMSAWAAAVSASVGARSMSALAGQFCCEAQGEGYYKVKNREILSS